MNPRRKRLLKKGTKKYGPVAYWMSRDQRVHDNWALIFAKEIADKKRVPLYVVFCLVKDFLNAGFRQYDFMIRGLMETEGLLKRRNIPFFLVSGKPYEAVKDFIDNNSISVLITDFDPLKIKMQWKKKLSITTDVDIYEVDAHNIIPCWETSSKREYAAYTIRPKIKKMLPEFLDDFPELTGGVGYAAGPEKIKKRDIDWNSVISDTRQKRNVPPVEWLKPGYNNSIKVLGAFLEKKIQSYNVFRNDPNLDVQSDLSPYLHFGQISAQRVVLEITKLDIDENTKNPFLEELIIRRELSDNFCFYNDNYDSFNGFPDWAKDTLNKHRPDKRPYIYNLKQLEDACTHDNLWNAAQIQLIKTGKMHGYLRMYWAKKILGWTRHPEEAIEYTIYLNDRYSIDGRDPNGYTGIAWSIGGVHDRAWKERRIFGKIRYMSYEGCRRKFDVDSYIEKINRIK